MPEFPAVRFCPECRRPVSSDERYCPDDGVRTSTSEQLPAGLHLGSYRIVGELGGGGMGEVFHAVHAELGKPVAIKLLRRELADDPASAQRFEREARAAAALRDPRIIRVYDFKSAADGATDYMVMELLRGVSLQELLEQRGPLPVPTAAHLAREMAGALGSAHQKGVVHRDIKPANLFVLDPEADRPRIKVLDFGIARLTEAKSTRLTRAGAVIGTPYYMSPEQASGEPVDARTDVYALGCVLHHMLTGGPPFRDRTPREMLLAQVVEEPPRPSDLVPGLPHALDAVVLRSLSKDPDERFQTMKQLASALAAFVENPGEPVVRGEGDPSAETVRGVPSVQAAPALAHSVPSAGGAASGGGASEVGRWVAGGFVALLLTGIAGWVAFGPGAPDAAPSPSTASGSVATASEPSAHARAWGADREGVLRGAERLLSEGLRGDEADSAFALSALEAAPSRRGITLLRAVAREPALRARVDETLTRLESKGPADDVARASLRARLHAATGPTRVRAALALVRAGDVAGRVAVEKLAGDVAIIESLLDTMETGATAGVRFQAAATLLGLDGTAWADSRDAGPLP